MDIFKRKLAAFLHDPPSKSLDIRTHGERSEKAMQAAGLGTPEERQAWNRIADHTAAAADRFPFPHHNKASLSCSFDGVRNVFRHPLDGQNTLPFDGPFISVEQAIEVEQTTQPVLNKIADMSESDQWRARFFAHWRLWASASSGKDWRLAYLPADTRIPDHSIWTHMQIVSAMEGCRNAVGDVMPAFLKFQLGPVQDFIQAARSTRDLWSGSYLLSWLMAHGLAALSLEIGPDAVVFPSLRNQPLVDIALKKDIWDRVKISDQSIWDSHDSMHWNNSELLTPNLPNVFLAIVPAERAKQLASIVEEAIRIEWERIAESVWVGCENEGLWNLEDNLQPTEQRRGRFDHQIKNFLSVSWSVLGWPKTLTEVEELAKRLPPTECTTHYQSVKKAGEMIRTLGHHDERYFDTNGELKNEDIAWSLLTMLNSWQLDAVRQTRQFTATTTDHYPGQQHNKDSLTGKEEAVAGGSAWKKRRGELAGRFKHDDYLSALTLVKRLWDMTYLHKASNERVWQEVLGHEPQSMPDTRSLAAHQPFENTAENDSTAEDGERYFAVIAFDGDDIGKWVSGEKTPVFAHQLADYEGGGSLEYFQRPAHGKKFEKFLGTRRPLSPAYHVQFSECLSNFALRCAHSIVDAYQGRLIYAGGDDVLALLPADTALACANDLQLAFTGRAPLCRNTGIQQKAPGFLTSKQFHESTGKSDPSNEALVPFMVPGPSASASVGIAIAHFKSPLQDAVRGAQAAEKRAKKVFGKAAVAVTLMKRSGETVEWTARWEDAGVQAAFTLLAALRDGVVSGKFPYRLGEAISPYRTQSSGLMKPMDQVLGFDLTAVFAHELRMVLTRQRGPAWNEKGAEFTESFTRHTQDWLSSLLAKSNSEVGEKSKTDKEEKIATSKRLDNAISQLLALCAYCGFAKRQDSEMSTEK
ncbi:MAG: type III-B CRISPR-associated protein Cas10/Cmr2, partial [Verrucomicrobiota bacterium]